MNLSTYVEQISDDFQSTFTVVSPNVLANMMGFKNDFDKLTQIVRDYIPNAELEFNKTNLLDDVYDMYLVSLKDTTQPHTVGDANEGE